MTALTIIIAGGVMTVLAGLVAAAGALLGFGRPPSRRPSRRRLRLSRRSLVAAGVGLVVFVASGWLLAGVTAGWCVVVVPELWSDKRAAVVITRLEALASWTRRLADLMASGAANSLEAALLRSTSMSPPAIEVEVARLGARLGPQGTESALRAFAEEIADPAGDHVAAALILRTRSGGAGLSLILGDLASDIEAQVANRRQIEADRAKPLSNVRMIIVLTGLMSVALVAAGGEYMAPFATVTGQVLLALPMGMMVVSLMWIRDLTKAVQGPRFLATPPTDARPAISGAAATADGGPR